jgi:hypothetical protein
MAPGLSSPLYQTFSIMKHLTTVFVLLLLICYYTDADAQKKVILVDVSHGQKFYSDPADGKSSDLVPTQRLNYMIGEMTKNAEASNATLAYQKSAITPASLAKADVLFIHVPSTKYTAEEVKAIQEFIGKGGGLFIVVEEDYWATLDQINANEILQPFGIAFKGNNPDNAPDGGHSSTAAVTQVKYKIPSHGARLVEGGTPFAFTNKSDANPIGVYKEAKGGGKIVAMGEGMVSLYMNSWQGVEDYQTGQFMGEVLGWLLR